MANFIISILPYICIIFAFSYLAQSTNGESFVKTQGTEFALDGRPFLFNGFNSYWMMHVAANPRERNKVTEVFSEAAANGLTVCRTWVFTDGGDRALQLSPGVYDERVFEALDFVISEAKTYGIHLILSFVNNFKDFGGRAQYVEWARNAGAAVNGEDDFYTSSVVKGYYQNHIKSILTRVNTITKLAYKDEPAILAWELINEPRCQSDYSGRTINAWVEEMAAYTKSLDSNHLLEVGMEGFYGDSMPGKKQYNPGYQVGTDYISSNLVKEIDFATIHAYPDIWLSGQNDGSQTEFVRRWMWSHWEDARTILRKPLIFAEFGKSKKDPGYSENERDVFINAVYTNIYSFARTGGGSMAGGLVWQVMAEGMDSYYDGYEIILPRDPSTTALINKQSHVMKVLAQTMRRPNMVENTGSEVGDASGDKSIRKPHFQARAKTEGVHVHAHHHRHHHRRHGHHSYYRRNAHKEQGQH
ncbi:mannan endo-1,4-beta-mannosidase 5-like protein [Carex littledalei]|uniref:mannan endo-1,4-beta-mannosidase n=1 Tax=Carex littledalei TaxID=544730 RepID=A0A833VDP3_9POAL|nr:mannan endo-1,4-beta-mannosidase 5-like protein [Carex littledalei]